MISSIRLVRFRGFEDATLNVRPLTLVMGPNSSGKSTFGQALVALQQVHRRRSVLARLDEENENDEAWPVDLGTYADLITEGCRGEVTIDLGVRSDAFAGHVEYGFGGVLSDSLELSRIKLSEDTPHAEPTAGGTAVHIASVSVDQRVVVPKADEFRRIDKSNWSFNDGIGNVQFDGLRLVRASHDSGTVFPVTSRVQEALLEQIDRLRYLRPNRMNPSRTGYAIRKRARGVTEVGTDGQWTASVLLDRASELLPGHRLPPVLPKTPAQAESGYGAAWDPASFSLSTGVNFWMNYLGLAARVEASKLGDGVDLRAVLEGDRPSRSLDDVGFGISQVLPVLVEGLVLPPGALFVVEQPESQLHPRAQARLGDFFCALAKRGNAAIVECHSEPMFRRIQTRVLLDPELAKLVQVAFIDESEAGRCQQPRSIELRGDVTWPKGFLEDAVEEELALLAASSVREAP